MKMITKAKMISLTITSMMTSSMSILGSASIITMLLRSEKKLGSTYRRLLFGMSIMDIIFSLSVVTGSFASPKGTPLVWSPVGNTTTCTLQGWALYSGNIGLTFYNCSLCLYYTLSIARNIKKDMMIRIERFFHAIPALWLVFSTIFLLKTKSINNFGVSCMISSYPRGCDSKTSDVECTRGENARHYRMILHVFPIMIGFVVICASMAVLCHSIRSQEKKMKAFRLNLQASLPQSILELRKDSITEVNSSTFPRVRRQKESAGTRLRKDAFKQAMCHVVAYFLSYAFAVIFQLIAFTGKMSFVAWYLQQLTTPAQGFFNFIVFLRPRIMSVRASRPELSLLQTLRWIFEHNGEDNDRHVLACQELSLPPERRQSRRYTAREWHMKTRAEEMKVLEEEKMPEEKDTTQHNDGSSSSLFATN